MNSKWAFFKTLDLSQIPVLVDSSLEKIWTVTRLLGVFRLNVGFDFRRDDHITQCQVKVSKNNCWLNVAMFPAK